MITITLTRFSAPSHALLSRAAALHTGQPEELFTELHILPGGKPVFSRCPDLHFSISHSGDLWACAFGDTPLGLDIQKLVEKPVERLAARWLHPAETAYLAACGYRDFFPVWCAKESIVKYSGSGIGGSFPHFAVADESGLLSHAEGCTLSHFTPEASYVGCLATKKDEEMGLIWF